MLPMLYVSWRECRLLAVWMSSLSVVALLQEEDAHEAEPTASTFTPSFAVDMPRHPHGSVAYRALRWVVLLPVRAARWLWTTLSDVAHFTKCCLRKKKAKISPTDGSFASKWDQLQQAQRLQLLQ